jgi:hypothetical protein
MADVARCEYCREPDDRSVGLLVLAWTLDEHGRCVACHETRRLTAETVAAERRRGLAVRESGRLF